MRRVTDPRVEFPNQVLFSVWRNVKPLNLILMGRHQISVGNRRTIRLLTVGQVELVQISIFLHCTYDLVVRWFISLISTNYQFLNYLKNAAAPLHLLEMFLRYFTFRESESHFAPDKWTVLQFVKNRGAKRHSPISMESRVERKWWACEYGTFEAGRKGTPSHVEIIMMSTPSTTVLTCTTCLPAKLGL